MAANTKNPHACRHRFILSLTRIAAFSFGLFVIAVVISANLGYGESLWPFIHTTRHADKLGHIGLFGTLGFLCNLAFSNFQIRHLPRCITAITFVLLILVSLEEISQTFIPNRHCDLFDWLADVGGLAIGQITALRCTRRLDHGTAF
jgi:VanZ family protein